LNLEADLFSPFILVLILFNESGIVHPFDSVIEFVDLKYAVDVDSAGHDSGSS
jgi:hypothetical protein